jgi:hypothetical protein
VGYFQYLEKSHQRDILQRQAWISIASLLLFCSCVANTVLGDAHNAENNVSRLSRVSLRMDKETVLKIMHAPYDKEDFRIGEDRYEVWFYVTSGTLLGQSRMVPRNLTPLTFRGQILVGFGYDYYYWLRRGGEIRTAVVNENEAMENKEIERALEQKAAPSPNGPAQNPPQGNGSTTPPKETTPPPMQPPAQAKPMQESSPTTNPPKSSPPPKQPPAPTKPKQESSSPPKPNPPPKPQPKQTPAQAKSVSMSKPPEKPPQASKSEQSDQPEWNKKDEEMNDDAMDQDFDFW